MTTEKPVSDDVMHKALQLARHQLGMPEKQAFCEHIWMPKVVDNLTGQVLERECKHCQLKQKAETVWRNIVHKQT